MEPAEQTEALVPVVDERSYRSRIIRETAVFYLKLFIDGTKDVLLAPLALTAAVIDLVRGPKEDPLLHKVLRVGAAFGRWLNVYGDEAPTGFDAEIFKLEAAYRERRKARADRP